MLATDVVVVLESAARRSVVETDNLLRPGGVSNDRLRHCRAADWHFPDTDRDGAAGHPPFRLNPQLVASRHDQHAAVGARVLDRRAQHGVDELLVHDLARDGLQDPQHSRELQVFDRCPDRARRTGHWLFLPEVRI